MTDEDTPTRLELLTFQLANQEYSLDIMSVREIRRWTKSTPLPHAPAYMKGVINMRGTVLPVMDLGKRLGLEPREHSKRNVIIVTKHEDITTGLLVDAVSDIIALASEDLHSPPDTHSTGSPSVVSALTLIEDRMIRVLNLEALLAKPQNNAA